MSKKLKVNSKVFNFPDEAKEPNWGQVISDWAAEVTEVLENEFGDGSIAETQSIIENNVSDAAQKTVAGMVFNNNIVKSAIISYRIYRKTNLSTESSESGQLTVLYSETDLLNKWSIQREINNGDPTLVYFDIDNSGQVKYHSSDKLVSGLDGGYEGYIRFKTVYITK
jgi:hypothetical protein